MSSRGTMSARCSFGQILSPHLLTAIFSLLSSAPSTAQTPQARHPGVWTQIGNPVEAFIPVHIALLPSSNPAQYHSKIMWWNDSHSGAGGFGGKVWKWTPTVQNDCGTYPAANFVDVPLSAPTNTRIFCTGLTQTRDQGGRLFISGGTEGLELGSRHNTIYDPVTDSWSSGGLMTGYRWYPTVTTLSDGRALILSGSKYYHTVVFGGKESPGGSPHPELNRFVNNIRGVWDAAIPPATVGVTWPEPRSYHAAAGSMLIFGGELGDGSARNDVWELFVSDGNLTAPDPAYSWAKREPPPLSPKPGIRRRLAALTTYGDTLWIFGGLGRNTADTQDEVKSDVWRLVNNGIGQWEWQQVTVSGDAPGPRFGHTAVFDRARNRVLLFGGAAQVGGPAVDTLDLKVQPIQWTRLQPVTATRPPARLGHCMLYDRYERPRDFHDGAQRIQYRAILYGGETQFGSGHLGDVWHLWITTQGAVEWVQFANITNPAEAPSPRSWLGATLDDTGVRLIVYGGATGPGAVANGQVHTLDITYEWPGYDNSPKTWRIMASQAFGLTGQTMHPQGFLLFERRPEIVVPGDSTTWQVLPPRLFKEWYPFVFSMPDGHAFVAGPSILQDGTNSATYKINVNTGQWTQLPAGSGSGFKGGSAAMYTPGEILKCGSRETEYNATALGTTKVIDLNVPSPVWQSSPNMRHPRVYHNLTLLPGGDILMTGGLGIVNASANLNPVFEPELWRPPDPQYPPYPQGTWYYGPAGTLAASSLVRGYHSVALLLPDGRVLVSGGNNHADATKVDMYCPPYLFKANGQLAARPQINEVPSEIRWGQTFTVCVADTANIRAACLIRPGAVTHGFDQNQRYVPLQIAGHAGSPQRLFLTAPANSFAAPPGYYLLFLTGSADGADVPSIAKWTRLDSPGGPDLCDVVPPGTITDLTPEVVGPNALWFLWTATADDALIAASGIEAYFDLRRSPVAFNSATWNTATECQNETPPWTLGTWASGGFDGLSPCTTYHFGVRAGDDAGLLSPFPGSTAFQTTCGGGGGGGGSSAHEAREERGPTTSTSESGFASSSGTEPPTSALVVETRRTATGDWQVTIRLASQADGIDPATSGIAIEREGGQGGWDILRTVTPSEDQGELGICSLRERGRVVIPDPYRLERVVPYLRHLSQDYRLNRAQHSRLGALGVEFVANGGQVDLADGDVVDLTYAPAAEPLEAASSWYLVVSRVANQSPSQFARRPSRGESFPRHFALYQNDPNPATARTVIRFDLPAESRVLLEVFDLLGRRVATLAEGTLPAGSHRAQWDLRDLSGQPVSPGVYVCRISSGEFRAHRKIGVLP